MGINTEKLTIDERDYKDIESEINAVYNRLQNSHRVIGELIELLGECHSMVEFNKYGEVLAEQIDTAIEKYGDINGD